MLTAIFICTAVAIHDADGPIWCAEGPRVRLRGIAAREIDNSCRSNQPCPPGDARAARQVVVRVLGTAVDERLTKRKAD